MLELVICLSIFLIFSNMKYSNKYIFIGVRITQMITVIYCLTNNHNGYLGNLYSLGGEFKIFSILLISLFAIDIEMKSMKRPLKEVLLILASVLILTQNLSIVIISSFSLILIKLLNRKSYVLDYISLSAFSIFSMIFFSELQSTVNLTSDGYYLFLSNISENIFYPLLVIYACLELSKLWGYKRNISVLYSLIPFLLMFKFKMAFSLDQEVINLLSTVLTLSLVFKLKKIITDNRFRNIINLLFESMIIINFIYMAYGQFEVSLVNTLIISFIYTLYSLLEKVFKTDVDISKINKSLSLMNLSFLPLSVSGLISIDLLVQSEEPTMYIVILCNIILSFLVILFTIKTNSEKLFVNLLEASNKLKIVISGLIILSITLIYINMSPFLSGKENARILMVKLFDSEIIKFNESFLSYNFTFLLLLIFALIVAYLIKLMKPGLVWRMGFNLVEYTKFQKHVVRSRNNKLIENNKRSYPSVNLGFDTEVSSYKVSFYILIIFLVLSLVIIEV